MRPAAIVALPSALLILPSLQSQGSHATSWWRISMRINASQERLSPIRVALTRLTAQHETRVLLLTCHLGSHDIKELSATHPRRRNSAVELDVNARMLSQGETALTGELVARLLLALSFRFRGVRPVSSTSPS